MELEEKGFEVAKLDQRDIFIIKRMALPRAIVFSIGLALAYASIIINVKGLSSLSYNLVVAGSGLFFIGLIALIFKQVTKLWKSGNKLIKTGIVGDKQHTISMHLSKRRSVDSERKAYRLDHFDVFIEGVKYPIKKSSFHDMRVGDKVELSFTENSPSFIRHKIHQRAIEKTNDEFLGEKVEVHELNEEDMVKLKKAYIYNPLALIGCLPLPILLLVLLFGISSGIKPVLLFGVVTVAICIYLIYRYRISISLKRKADEQQGKKEIVPAIVLDYYQSFRKQAQRNIVVTSKGDVYMDATEYKKAKVNETVLLIRSAKHKMPFDIYFSKGV